MQLPNYQVLPKAVEQPKYNIYPSLLDSFSWYLKNESDTATKEFIDRINRVPQPYSEAADKGTKFNLLTDYLIGGRIPEGWTQQGEEYVCPASGEAPEFRFPTEIADAIAEEVMGSVTQVFCECYIPTGRGVVRIYGYCDNVIGNTVIDQKTISKAYEFPKFLHNWQHVVYPFALNEMGVKVDTFTYLITDFKTINKEDYIYNPDTDRRRLMAHVDRFIDFLESVRPLITDPKIIV